MKTAKDRLLQFIESQKITKSFFEQKNSLSSGTFSNKSAIASDKLLKIFRNYPDLNMDWVITGRGKMLNDNTPEGTANNYDEGHASIVNDDGIEAKPKEEMSMQAILSLTRSNETLSKANADLARNTLELTLMLKTTGSAPQEIPEALEAKFRDFQELLADVAAGKRFQSKQEALAEYSKRLHGTKGV